MLVKDAAPEVTKDKMEPAKRAKVLADIDKVIIDKDKLTIIDYKTGEEKKEDVIQIKGYKSVFQDLNYKYVEAKLVYLNDEIKIIEL